MNVFDGRHYRINKFFLSCIGQWPYQTARRKYVSLAILFLLFGTQVIAKLCATIPSYNNMDVVMDDMTPLMADLAAIMKLLNAAAQTTKLEKLLTRIQLDYDSITTEDELKIMHEYAEDGRKFTVMYLGYFMVTMSLFVFPPLIPIISYNGTGERPFVHHTQYFVNPLNYYYLIIFHSYITIFGVVILIVTMDTMLVVIVQHACGLFTATGYRLCHITDNDGQLVDIDPSKEKDESFRYVSLCVRKHQEAIEFSNLVESYYSASFFLHAGLNAAGLSLAGFQAIATTDVETAFKNCAIFYSGVGHLFFECVNGQRLIDHSSRVHEYLIDMKWYHASLRTRKIIKLMILRTQHPCVLTAASMFVISMETFSLIIRTSMSYFTVLRSTQ